MSREGPSPPAPPSCCHIDPGAPEGFHSLLILLFLPPLPQRPVRPAPARENLATAREGEEEQEEEGEDVMNHGAGTAIPTRNSHLEAESPIAVGVKGVKQEVGIGAGVCRGRRTVTPQDWGQEFSWIGPPRPPCRVWALPTHRLEGRTVSR